MPLVAVVLVVILSLVVVAARLGDLLVERAAAQSAADATALAGALSGQSAAAAVATANDAAISAYREAGALVQVEVRRGHAMAVATAERYPAPASGP